MEKGIFKFSPSSPETSASDRDPGIKAPGLCYLWRTWRARGAWISHCDALQRLYCTGFAPSLGWEAARESLCHCLWSGLKNHTWVFSQEVDSSTMPRKSRKSRGTGSNELREKSIITSEVLAKHLSHTSFIFLWTLPAP